MTREVMPPVADNERQTVQVFQNKNASISVYGSLLPKNFARRPRLLRRVSTPLETRPSAVQRRLRSRTFYVTSRDDVNVQPMGSHVGSSAVNQLCVKRL